MHGYEVAVFERPQNVEALVWILAGVLLHPGHQGLSVARKVRIVMPKAGRDMPCVCLANTAGGGEMQKRNSRVFPGRHDAEL
jgi:hypothetical protein